MHRNIPELLVFFCLIFSDNKMLFFGLSFILYVLQLSRRNGFWHLCLVTPLAKLLPIIPPIKFLKIKSCVVLGIFNKSCPEQCCTHTRSPFLKVSKVTQMRMSNCAADIEKAIHYLSHGQLYSVQRVELLRGVYKLDSTLQNSSENHLITNLLSSSEISSIKNLNKEIVFLTINVVKTSEHFFEPLFLPLTSICIYDLYFLFFFS